MEVVILVEVVMVVVGRYVVREMYGYVPRLASPSSSYLLPQ